MGDSNKGTDNFSSNEIEADWFIIREAECVNESLDELFENSTASTISNLIDDTDNVDQGNSLALFQEQYSAEYDKDIADLKRKYTATPEKPDADISPRLSAVHISPEKGINSKRRLLYDSGIADDEAENSIIQVSTETEAGEENGGQSELMHILKSSNVKATLLSKFKEKFGVPFNELTRAFKSNKTCTKNWVVSVMVVSEELIEASKTLLQQHAVFFQVIDCDFNALYVIEFVASKNRDTILHLFKSMLNVKEEQLLCEPPRLKSVPAALFFYKKSIANCCYKFGNFPEWISALTIVNHQLATAETFKLSEMVQWAYDNDWDDEPSIAYHYALYANENANAAAFLNCNSQVKYVKDCYQMVKLYKKQEMRNMSMTEWIDKCCKDITPNDDWKEIVQFLKYQHINFLEFLIAFKLFLKGIPKKTCIVIYGPPDTGKSFFCFKLVSFLRGKVVSYMNKNSHFWLSPLAEAKIGFLDDATMSCWIFMDSNMRNAFDGNKVSIDVKHKNLQEIKLPPMFITTNINVTTEPTLMYLKSRLKCFSFPNPLPIDDKGNPLYTFSDSCWASFFSKFRRQLELSEEDASGDEREPERPFCCTAGHSVEPD